MRRSIRIFLLCGIGIVASMVWTLVAAPADETNSWPESAALWFFAWSWLTKGRALRSISGPPAPPGRR